MMEMLKNKIPSHVFQRLQAVGIESSDYFLLESKQEICDRTKLSRRDVNNLIHFVSQLNLNKTFSTALDLLSQEYAFISLGCPKLDEAIKGIPKNGITEIYGESSTGKTQMGLQLLHNDGNNDTGSIYICTEDAFPSKRLEELLSIYSPEKTKKIMDNIYIEHIHELDRLKYCIDIKIPVLLSRTRTKINLIVIDSITSIFRYDNETNDYISRTEDLRYLTVKLNKLSIDYNISIVCINQVTSDPKIGLKPCLGLSWSNLIRKRIQLKRTNNSISLNNKTFVLRKMKVIFGPDVARNEISYIIEKEGVKGL